LILLRISWKGIGNRFLPPKLATLRFSSRNDKAPGCGWGERKRARSARFLSPQQTRLNPVTSKERSPARAGSRFFGD